VKFGLVFLVIVFVVFLPGCSAGGKSGEIVYVGWDDLFVIDMAAGKIIEKIAVGSSINDIEPAKEDRLFLATERGFLVVDTADMEVIEQIPLGMLDSVEYDELRDVIYVLIHPGNNPNQSTGPHKLLKLSGEDYTILASVFLEPWIYDIFLSPSGDIIYATQMAGRTVIRIDPERPEESEKLFFGEGGEWEARMVLLRHISFSRDGSTMYLLEQGRTDQTCLWFYIPETGEKTRKCLEEKARIQGLVTSADGTKIFANGLDEFIVLDTVGEEISRTSLSYEHRWPALSSDGSTVYLTASTGDEEGIITCVDALGEVVREVKFETPLSTIAVDKYRAM
jgi:hypothetical protein